MCILHLAPQTRQPAPALLTASGPASEAGIEKRPSVYRRHPCSPTALGSVYLTVVTLSAVVCMGVRKNVGCALVSLDGHVLLHGAWITTGQCMYSCAGRDNCSPAQQPVHTSPDNLTQACLHPQ
jgi:hypothetical protein